MNTNLQKTLLWLPRILGILFVLFTSLFSFDVFGMGQTIWEELLAFLLHLLIPTILLAVIVVVAWRWEWVGALGFGGWGLFYIISMMSVLEADAGAINLIGVIPLLIGILYLVSILYQRRAAR